LKQYLMVGLVGAVLGLSAPVMACPDWQGQPHFGQIDLQAGFQNDPLRYNVTAGGTTDVSRCINGTAGFVTNRPDFDMYWSGQSAQLTIAVESNADAVLLVNDPNGNWFYSDDYRGSNPAIIISNPAEGLYDIWIGSYDGSRRNPAYLVFTEYQY
jgi:hypothetical protein